MQEQERLAGGNSSQNHRIEPGWKKTSSLNFSKLLPIIRISILGALCACTRKHPLILVDDKNSVTEATRPCRVESEPNTIECVQKADSELHAFEMELAAYFASDENCKGTVIASNRGAQSPDKLDWRLMLDDSESLRKWMVMDGNNSNIMVVNGSPKEIVHTVCGIAKGNGGAAHP